MYEKDRRHLGIVANDLEQVLPPSLPARVSEQGNVIGSVHIYICDRIWENSPLCALLQNRVIGIQG